MAKLTSEQKRTVKRIAKDIIKIPVLWSDVGQDRKEEWFMALLQKLRDGENKQIAIVLENDKPQAYTLLQEKTKSMRSQERKELNRYDPRKARTA